MAPSPPNLPLQPGVVTLSKEEQKAGTWNRENKQKIAELMHRDGIAVLNGLIDTSLLDNLRIAMTKTSNEIKAAKTQITDYNHGVATNFLQSPPMSNKELLYPEVYDNKFVQQALEIYLGQGISLAFVTANTALANTKDRQPVHKDASFVSPAAPYMAVVNFLLSDFKPENGSTEFWLGSHVNTSPAEQAWLTPESVVPTCNILPHLLDERRKTRPPVQVTVPFGSLLLRDPRVWHAGMPNPSPDDRIMIALGYSASWFPEDQRFFAPDTIKPLFSSSSVPVLCNYLPAEEWDKISQKWGMGEPMQLKYAPHPETWDTVNMMKNEEKVLKEEGAVAVSG